MPRLLTAIVALVWLSMVSVESALSKVPPPDVDAEKTAQSQVDEAFKEDIAQAISPLQQTEVAIKILQTGTETNNDSAGRYALFKTALKVAIDTGDIETAYRAIDEMDKLYQMDALKMKVDAINEIARGNRISDVFTYTHMVAPSNTVIDTALAVERYDLARQVVDAVLAAAHGANDTVLIRQFTMRAQEVQACAEAFHNLKIPLATLANKPTDPEANLAVGRYRCFIEGDWTRGLPMLAIGSDSELKAMAQQEMAGAAYPESKVALGDGWWKIAETQKYGARNHIQQHAAIWYRDTAQTLAGLAKAKVELRLNSLLPAGDAVRPMEPKRSGNPSQNGKTFLADLPEQEVLLGDGSFDKNGIGDATRTIGGVGTAHCIFMHPPNDGSSHAMYDLSQRQFTIFRSKCGLDDRIGRSRIDNGLGPLVFRVVGDGKDLWRSKPMNQGGESDTCEVNVIGVRKFELFVDCQGNCSYAHSMWVDPVLSGPEK